MIELKLEPYCQNCGSFEAETEHQVLYADQKILEEVTTVICKNASKCAKLYDYIWQNELNQISESDP